MAKQVSEILVKLGIQGAEGLDKLSSAFRSLEKSIGPTDRVIQDARQSIIDFAGSGKQSIQTIQGQIDAFKGLQTQATIGGNVYRQLAGDVNRLSDSLKALKTDYEEVGRVAKRTDAQIAAEFPARKPEAFRKQLAALNRQLDQLSVSAQAYGDKLTEITIKEVAFGRAQARQQVIAGAQAVGAPLIRAQQPQQQLPNTLAALQLRISELTQDFQNLDRAGAPYQDTLAEINRLQRELSSATEDGNADRKEEIRARIENYRQITAENTGLREQAAIRRSIERGRARTAAGAPAIIQEPTRRTSSLFEGIANIAAVSTRRETELLGKSYSDVAVTIQKVSATSDGSIASLQAQRGAWQALRNQIDPTTADFKQASREIERLDRRLGKLQQTQGRRMGGMQMAQAAGAAISGGIFGGPEGFLGGAVGGIAGGVGGAFVGAAAGAQVGMLRQQLGGFADYAAQIQKMQIALENAAGSQSEFNRAMAAAASATQNLNLPQDVAIQGMTKLTAAVRGAGGQVSDAELVFRNVSSAIKATGGSAQDVDGAITAMVQVFSKGKVSAEELSGQLGERLPGAVTKFAKANDMTLPELQKALEQGQVGLNELMNFIVQLGDEYSGVAEKIAASSQDSGARLTIAFNEMKIAVGTALQPIGAQFQEAFVPFIENITPALASALPAIGNFALGLAKNIDVLAASLSALAAGAIVNAIVQTGGLIAAFKALTAAVAASNAVLLLNPWVALAAGITAATVALVKHNQAQEEYKNLLDNGAGSTDELKFKQQELESQIIAARKALEGSADGMGATGRRAMQLKMRVADLESQLARINKTFTIRLKLEREGFSFDESGNAETYTVAGVVYSVKTGRPIRRADGTPLNGRTEFPQLTDGDGGRSAKSAADKAAREEARIQERLRSLDIETENIIRQAVFKGKIAEAENLGNKELAIKLRGEARAQQISEQLERSLIGITDERVKQALLVKSQAEIDAAGIDTAIELEQQRLAVIKEQNNELFKRAGFTPQDAMKKGAGALDPSLPDLRISPAESQMNQYRKELEALTNPINMAVTGANAIGNAFGQAFQSIATGAQSTRQALADAFKAIGEAFIQMAAEIIAKQLAMIAFQLILRALGGSGNFKFGGEGPAKLPGGAGFAEGFSMPSILASANGNAFAQNGIQPFAMGGIVTRPTFFKYAKGGEMQNGLMGEAGPEAIMPLERGADGKLGVRAKIDSAMGRYQPVSSSAEAASREGTISAGDSTEISSPIDVRYTVERINSVDYVTAEEFRLGMRKAATEGAVQGERRAIKSLQNNRSTRGRLGMR